MAETNGDRWELIQSTMIDFIRGLDQLREETSELRARMADFHRGMEELRLAQRQNEEVMAGIMEGMLVLQRAALNHESRIRDLEQREGR